MKLRSLMTAHNLNLGLKRLDIELELELDVFRP